MLKFLRTTAEGSRERANPCPWHKSSLLQVVENPGTSRSFHHLRQDETEYQPTRQRKEKELKKKKNKNKKKKKQEKKKGKAERETEQEK